MYSRSSSSENILQKPSPVPTRIIVQPPEVYEVFDIIPTVTPTVTPTATNRHGRVFSEAPPRSTTIRRFRKSTKSSDKKGEGAEKEKVGNVLSRRFLRSIYQPFEVGKKNKKMYATALGKF